MLQQKMLQKKYFSKTTRWTNESRNIWVGLQRYSVLNLASFYFNGHRTH